LYVIMPLGGFCFADHKPYSRKAGIVGRIGLK